jgi:hypothetical protein
MSMTSHLTQQEKHEFLDNISKIEDKLIPRCECCFETVEEVNDCGYCDNCEKNGKHCKVCYDLFVDDCIGDLCYDCRLDVEE